MFPAVTGSPKKNRRSPTSSPRPGLLHARTLGRTCKRCAHTWTKRSSKKGSPGAWAAPGPTIMLPVWAPSFPHSRFSVLTTIRSEFSAARLRFDLVIRRGYGRFNLARGTGLQPIGGLRATGGGPWRRIRQGPNSNVRSRSSLRSVERKVGRFSGCELPSVFPSDDGN